MDDLVVLRCRNALELFEWGKAYAVAVPLLPNGRAALSGYAFVPVLQWPELRRHCPERLNVTVLGYDLMKRPKTIRKAELQVMQDYINRPADGLPVFTVGERIKVLAGPFSGFVGHIVKIKPPEARILLGTLYITLSLGLLAKDCA